MDERDQERQPINARPKGPGRLRAGVESARIGAGAARLHVEDAAWYARQRLAWPVEDRLDALGTRGRIGVFGGGGIAVAGVAAALVIALSGGSGSSGGGSTEAFVATPAPTAVTKVSPAPRPKAKPAKPSGPTLHGAAPDFAPAKDVRAGVGDGTAVGKKQSPSEPEAPAPRGAAASASDDPAATAKIGSTPAATTSAEAQADSLATGAATETAIGAEAGSGTAKGSDLAGPPAPKAAKQVARRFAEAFVVYEVGGVDSKVRKTFGQTTTKQLSKSLLKRPPRQPATVKVPRAKVVNVVAGPSQGTVYSVSVSLLRVGVTSELRLELEQGAGKKWQVTNVLG